MFRPTSKPASNGEGGIRFVILKDADVEQGESRFFRDLVPDDDDRRRVGHTFDLDANNRVRIVHRGYFRCQRIEGGIAERITFEALEGEVAMHFDKEGNGRWEMSDSKIFHFFRLYKRGRKKPGEKPSKWEVVFGELAREYQDEEPVDESEFRATG